MGRWPVEIHFQGSIGVKGDIGPKNRCGVKYVLDRSNGVPDTVKTSLTFTSPGTKSVSTTWTLSGPELPHLTGWEAIRIKVPGPERQWRHAGFEVACSVPPAPKATIASVESVADMGVKVHIKIGSVTGISSFKVFSVWGGRRGVEQTFVTPMVTFVDRVVTIAHSAPDPVGRDHQWGPSLELPGIASPILTYGMGPTGPDGPQHCPGHCAPPAVKR